MTSHQSIRNIHNDVGEYQDSIDVMIQYIWTRMSYQNIKAEAKWALFFAEDISRMHFRDWKALYFD